MDEFLHLHSKCFVSVTIRGAIKTFSAWPSSVQNKIKIEFASYGSKAQNTTCTIWLLGYKYFVPFSGRQLFVFNMEKKELHSVMKWQFYWFVRSIAYLVVPTQNRSVDAHFILNNELWNKFLLGHIGIVWEVLQKLVDSLVLAFSSPIWQTLCSYAKMHS